MNVSNAVTFPGLVDLASVHLGAKAVAVSDDFFAGVENLMLPGRAVFIADKFTDRGKWMDGWESRRKRVPGHDWCVLELGERGQVFGLDIDTGHFNGNHPSYASVEGVLAPRGSSIEALEALEWTELLVQSPLKPDAQNLFTVLPAAAVSHIRLRIFPDGGVARFRVYGRVVPDWSVREADRDAETSARVLAGLVDLAAVRNGGSALACSDARFGPMNNLLLPGRGANMGEGWETRRSRGPNRDWIIVALGARGRPQVLEIDTHHFKGNFPHACALDGIDAPKARITDLVESQAWVNLLPEQKLSADTRHFYAPPQLTPSLVSHVRLTILPDGGLSRLRVWSERDG